MGTWQKRKKQYRVYHSVGNVHLALQRQKGRLQRQQGFQQPKAEEDQKLEGYLE